MNNLFLDTARRFREEFEKMQGDSIIQENITQGYWRSLFLSRLRQKEKGICIQYYDNTSRYKADRP